MRTIFLFLFFVSATAALSSQALPKTQTMSGRVIAYSGIGGCLNGNGYWSMIIRVRKSYGPHDGFVRVEFSLPCDKTPEWKTLGTEDTKFRLRRERGCDAVLEEFTELTDVATSEHRPVPIWKYPAGSERNVLPFGEVLLCYHSIDLPLVPVF